jgi:diguanylate cyclase (GGDEF)-like protein
MDSIIIGVIVVPGITAFLLLMIFTYLFQQSREAYFRAWQLGWASWTLYYVAAGFLFSGRGDLALYTTAKLLQVFAVLAILISTRLTDGEHFKPAWYDWACGGVGLGFIGYKIYHHWQNGHLDLNHQDGHLEIEVFLAAVLIAAAIRFYRLGRQRDFLGFRLIAAALTFWAILMTSRQFHEVLEKWLGNVGHVLGPLPVMLLGIAQVIVLYEHERRTVQDNTLYFSTLDVDSSHLVSAAELAPSAQHMLERLARLLRVEQAAICIAEPWRKALPNVSLGFPADFIRNMELQEITDYLIDMAYRRGGIATFRNIATMTEPLPAGPQGRFDRLKDFLGKNAIRSVTAISLQTREKNFGVVLFPHPNRSTFGPSQIRLLIGLSMQIGMTLENFVAIQETQRRTREYELMTQMGQVISSHLDADEVLLAIHREIGLLVDTHTFYIAFVDGDELRFELEVIEGEVRPKRSRRVSSGLSEYVVRTAQPLLVASNMEEMRQKIGAPYVPGRPAKSFCGVPIFMEGRSAGLMAALNYEHEFVYSERDVELLQTASGQVAVAVENARLFAEQQRRAKYLAFLNNISKTAISSQDAEQMLDEIVTEIQKNFELDHIGIGMLDYATKEIEIRAEAGTTNLALRKRIPLGVGIMGKVARANEMILVQKADGGHLLGVLPNARSVLCLPLTYGETLLGVLNIESVNEQAFKDQDVLILRTLADLLATALHNAFVFQKLQQQSITDGLTGIKTRRFFLEAVQGEWKRASRSGRPFSVVMIDLDKFKEVNDGMGHLEGDLVLARVGRLLEQKCRQSNVVARYGGDEFVILMPETGIEQAQILSERLRLWVATDPMLNERHISGSFGVASFPLHGSTVEDIMRVADAGMYVSKHAGGNRVSTAEEFREGETAAVQRQLIASYIEGFLQRENMGPDAGEELVATLKKMCAGLQDDPEPMKEAIIVLGRAAEAREGHNTGHGQAVSKYAEMIARELGLNQQEITDIAFCGLVHDVGKLVIPERMLTKTEHLTDDEHHIMRLHPALSADIVGSIPGGEHLQYIVRHHHEWYDGTGYPDGLKGEEIPLASRILMIADSYASMTRELPYSPARTVPEAAMELEQGAGTQFDPNVVGVFLHQLRGEHAARKATR